MTRPRTGALVLAVCCAAGACSGAHDAPSTSAAVSDRPAVTGARPAAQSGRCPHDGRWRTCSLVDRLDKAGLVPQVDTTAPPERLPFFHAPGTVVHLGLGELHTFLYDDTTALTRDLAAFDTVRATPRGGSYSWKSTPTFVRSANLVAVLLTPNERQIERVQLALEAGPPQAGGGAR